MGNFFLPSHFGLLGVAFPLVRGASAFGLLSSVMFGLSEINMAYAPLPRSGSITQSSKADDVNKAREKESFPRLPISCIILRREMPKEEVEPADASECQYPPVFLH